MAERRTFREKGRPRPVAAVRVAALRLTLVLAVALPFVAKAPSQQPAPSQPSVATQQSAASQQSAPSRQPAPLNPETWRAPEVQTGTAVLVREYAAPEARQGVAVDAHSVYAIVNTVVARYDKQSGALLSRWLSPRGGPIRHINSCYAASGKLWCSNSNFPEVPMGSSIEVIDTATMRHERSHSLGLMDEGSLTFFEPYLGGFIAGFTHYEGTGGVGYKNSRYSSIVTFDAEWRRTGGWLIPESVQSRMAPHAASGGGIGPDGLLYLLGHDRTELYALAKPRLGPVLLHLATLEIAAEGQALVWDHTVPGRRLYAISRPKGVIRAFDIPEVEVTHPDATRFPAPAWR